MRLRQNQESAARHSVTSQDSLYRQATRAMDYDNISGFAKKNSLKETAIDKQVASQNAPVASNQSQPALVSKMTFLNNLSGVRLGKGAANAKKGARGS